LERCGLDDDDNVLRALLRDDSLLLEDIELLLSGGAGVCVAVGEPSNVRVTTIVQNLAKSTTSRFFATIENKHCALT
jgi:hypothetical protein